MSFSFGDQETSSTQRQSGQQDPWDEAIPGLKEVIERARSLLSSGGVTDEQKTAFEQLKAQAAKGNPYAGQTHALANDLFNTQSQSGMVKDAYGDFKTRLTSTADGANLDIRENPHLQALLQQVGDDAQSRVNSSFAAAGRTGSGANQSSVARGVTQAQLPMLLDQYNKEQGRTDAAARDLFSGGNAAASSIANLDKLAQDQRTKGIDVGKAALEADAYGPSMILNLEQQMQDLDSDWLTKLSSILFGAGSAGQQQTQTGRTNTESRSYGLGFSMGGGGSR